MAFFRRKKNNSNTTEIILAQMDYLITSNNLSKDKDPEVSIVISEFHGALVIEIKTIKDHDPRTLVKHFRGKGLEKKIIKWLKENKMLKFKKQVLNSITVKSSDI